MKLQGPCKADEWLVPTYNATFDSVEPACQPNVCRGQTLNISDADNHTYRAFSEPPKFFFAHENNCFVAGTQAFCGVDQVAIFVRGSTFPGCYSTKVVKYGLCGTGAGAAGAGFASGEPASCPEGYDEDSAGDCSLVNK